MYSLTVPTTLRNQIKLALLREVYRQKLLTEAQFAQLAEHQRLNEQPGR